MPGGMKADLTAGMAMEVSNTQSDSSPAAMNVDPATVTPQPIDKSFTTQGVYSEANIQPVSWASATAGIRYDRNSLFDNKLSPRTALFVNFRERFGGKLLFAQGFRNPSVFEAFFEDGRFYKPVTTLDPETITSREGVAWVRPIPGLKVRLSGWQWDAEDLIEKNDDFDRIYYTNVSSGITSKGIEVEGTYRNIEGWFAFTSLAFSDVKRSGNQDQENAPELIAKGGLSSPLLGGVVHASSELMYISSLESSNSQIDSFVGWNATLYFPTLKGFDLLISVRNILGTRQQMPVQDDYNRKYIDTENGTPTDINISSIPGPGREFFARIGYRL